MHEKTVSQMLQRYEKALSVRVEFEDLYDEIFEYCLPQRQGFKNYSAGQRRDDKIFDETAVVGIQEFASRLQSGLTPNFARWADFVTGQEVPDAEKDDKGQMELIAEEKNKADKTLVYQSNSLRQGESAPDRLQVIAAILLPNSRICFNTI